MLFRSIETSANNLSFNPSTGTLTTQQLNITPNTNIYSNSSTINTTSPTTFDTFDATVYRSAFYDVQMEVGGSFHATRLTLINSGSSALVQTSGDVYTSSPLATFGANVTSGLVNLIITPINSGTVVSFLRHALTKKGLGIPTGSLGLVTDSVSVIFDAGFDSSAVASSYDYGYVH